MKLRDLIDELIQLETRTSPDLEVDIDIENIPGLDTLYGCLIEEVSRNKDGDWVIKAVAP